MADYFLSATTRRKYAGETKPYTIDLKSYLRSFWIAGRRYAQNDIVRAPSVSGFAFQQTNAAGGEAGPVEPSWPRVLGATVIDGSLSWQAIAPGMNAVDSIGSVNWAQLTPPDNALTISPVSNTIEEATAQFAAGTAGLTYRIRCQFTTAAANTYWVEFDLDVS